MATWMLLFGYTSGKGSAPVVLGLELLAEQDGGVPNALLNNPAALLDAGHQLEHAAPPPVRALSVACQEPAHAAVMACSMQ